MKIIADENIPYVKEAFSTLGTVITVSGRTITNHLLRDAEILLVRSITKVDQNLLENTPVRFVATATIGEDHIDKQYLQEKGIGFASAPGCNANSVGDYVISALLALQEKYKFDLTQKSIGIIGVGNVGLNVFKKATGLGITCVLNDPPLARKTGSPMYRPLEELFACDIITLHVPLTREGVDATYHLVNDTFLKKMKQGAILINTSRGPVVDETALKYHLTNKKFTACVLDVWENEPHIDVELLQKVDIATPHIAGYSFDGKVNGTRQIYEAVCKFLNLAPIWDPTPILPPPDCPEVMLNGANSNFIKELSKAVFAVYDVRKDDDAMRKIVEYDPKSRGNYFDQLRKLYPRRREFIHTKAYVSPANPTLEKALEGLGFQLIRDFGLLGGNHIHDSKN